MLSFRRNRPELVLRAVESVAGQTYRNLEIIVVIDGPDSATEAALGGFADPRLRALALPESRGGSDARNAGIAAAEENGLLFWTMTTNGCRRSWIGNLSTAPLGPNSQFS